VQIGDKRVGRDPRETRDTATTLDGNPYGLDGRRRCIFSYSVSLFKTSTPSRLADPWREGAEILVRVSHTSLLESYAYTRERELLFTESPL
jgi:hypothetical protein